MGLKQGVRRVWQRLRLRRWRQVMCERTLLASLDDRALRDIGLSRADVERELSRPFWQEPEL